MTRRPLTIISISLIIGIIFQYKLSLSLISILAILILNTLITGLILKKNRYYYVYFFVFALIFLGALLTEIELNNNGQLDKFIDNKVYIYGEVTQKNVGDDKEYYFIAKEVFYEKKSFKVDEKTLLQIQDYSVNINIENKLVFLQGTIEKPEGNRNPGLFSYKMYLKNRGVYSIVYSQLDSIRILGDINILSKDYIRSSIKSYIYTNTQEIIKEEEGNVALSIVFGDKSILDKNIYESFRISGVAHILAVSGLHFGILFLLLNSILSSLKLKKIYASAILISVIWFFAFLSGYPTSGIRAATMLTAYILSDYFDRRYDLFSSLFFIGIVTLIIKPLILFDVGFQLSFVAVISIGMFYRLIYEKLRFLPDYLNKITSASISAQIGLVPLIAYHFNIFTPWSVIFNIPIIILTGYVLPTTLLFFLSIPINKFLANSLGVIDKYLIRTMIHLSKLSNYVPYSSLAITSPKIYYLVLYYCFLIVLLYKEKIKILQGISKIQIAIITSIICMFFSIFSYLYTGDLKITFIDVGQGDCALIETPYNKKILVDGGNFKENNLLTEFLLKNHISKVDLIFLSHIHNDHLGGLVNVLDTIKVDKVVIGTDKYISEEWVHFLAKCEEKKIPVIKVYKGNDLQIENDLSIEVLGPTQNLIHGYGDNTNNDSLILLLTYKKFDILFTGDIEKRAEDILLVDGPSKDIEVLKVAHHGSVDSTSPEFLNQFKPGVAIIQVGKNNYGHPSQKLIDQLYNRKIKTYRNDKHGAVIIKSDGYEAEIFKTLEN